MGEVAAISKLANELRADRRSATPDDTARAVVWRCGVESHVECVRYLIRELRNQHQAVVRDVVNRALEV